MLLKQYMFFALVFGVIGFHISAQDAKSQVSVGDAAPRNSAESGSVLPVILHGDSLGIPLRAGDFVLPDGTNLSTEELKQRLFTVPENDKYVSRAGGWTAAYWTAFGIGCAAAAMDIVYLFNEDLPYRMPMIAALSGGVVLGIVTGDLFIVMRNRNLNRAVRNYNLSVMGIPIP
jgi:hypothetical protein